MWNENLVIIVKVGIPVTKVRQAPTQQQTSPSLQTGSSRKGLQGLGRRPGTRRLRLARRFGLGEKGRDSEANLVRKARTRPMADALRARAPDPGPRGPSALRLRAGFTYPSGSPEVRPDGTAAWALFLVQPPLPTPPRPG